jgi:glycosyltransferase involved in cell wall biosynthesis
VIHSGIDSERFVTRERNVDLAAHYGIDSTRHSVFGIVARLAEEKGHVYLVQAFALVHREMPNARLMIIGDGPLLNAVQRQVRELRLGDVVIFTGLQRNIPELLALLDAFCALLHTRIVSARGARGDGGGQTPLSRRVSAGARGGWHHGISLRAPECRGACGTHGEDSRRRAMSCIGPGGAKPG